LEKEAYGPQVELRVRWFSLERQCVSRASLSLPTYDIIGFGPFTCPMTLRFESTSFFFIRPTDIHGESTNEGKRTNWCDEAVLAVIGLVIGCLHL